MTGEIFGGLITAIVAIIGFTGFVWYRSKRNEEISKWQARELESVKQEVRQITTDVIELKTDKRHDDDQKKKIDDNLCRIQPLEGRVSRVEEVTMELKKVLESNNDTLNKIYEYLITKY